MARLIDHSVEEVHYKNHQTNWARKRGAQVSDENPDERKGVCKFQRDYYVNEDKAYIVVSRIKGKLTDGKWHRVGERFTYKESGDATAMVLRNAGYSPFVFHQEHYKQFDGCQMAVRMLAVEQLPLQ